MAKKLLIDAKQPEETRVVLLNGNRIEDFDQETTTKLQNKGNIYLARVTRVEPSLQAAFVEYGGTRHGFLAFSEIHPDYYRIPVEDRKALTEEMIKAIHSYKYNDYCPVENLRLWMFENRNDRIFAISDKNVALIIKKYALQAGFDQKKYAGHSLRSGFATTTAEFGASERNIMAMTGHKSVDMVRRYIKEADLFKNNALNKILNK